MKYLLLLGLTTKLAFASPDSIIPDRVVYPFIDIFSNKVTHLNDEEVRVPVSTYYKDGEVKKGKETITLPKTEYQRIHKLSSAVFQMIPNESFVGETSYKGTAFHIGENLVLTNHHVLSPDRSVSNDCNGFELLDNESSAKFKCKKVIFCDNRNDVCLIEMNPAKICKNFLCSKYELKELKDGPKLSINTKALKTSDNTEVLSCIGNTLGLGIHFTSGSGYFNNGINIQFYAPLRSGNSGGPLLNDKGEVVGVVKQETKIKYGSEAYNVALGIPELLKLVEDEVLDEVTLKKFQRSLLK